MASRILFFACLIAAGNFIVDAHAQAPLPETGAAASTTAQSSKPSTGQTKQQISAAKKAERVAIRKKRAQCYDQAKKETVPSKDLARYLDDCRKK
jgi:hypothetical protein